MPPSQSSKIFLVIIKYRMAKNTICFAMNKNLRIEKMGEITTS